MLTIRAMSDGAGYASNHLEHRDYYAEGERVVGRWQGHGAERLGLAGEVKSEDFEALRQGLDPKTGEFLRQRKSADRIAADGTTQSHGRTLYDFTMSAPKSVSMMAILGGDERLIAAHETAVFEALQELQSHAAVRVRRGGANENRTTGNLALAVYHHDTSRELDPQLHTHAVAANLSYDGTEGRWKALQASAIYGRRAYLTEVYRNALAREVQAFGYEIDNRRDKKGRDAGFEIRGIPDELLNKFSQRSRQRDIAVQQFTRQKGREPTDNEVAILIRETRPDKLLEISTVEVQKRQQERLTPADRQMIAGLRRQSNAQAVRLDSVTASLEYAKEHIFERVSVAADHEVLTEALRHGRGRIDPQALKNNLKSHESFVLDENEVATTESLIREREMIQTINEGVGSFPRLGSTTTFVSSQMLGAEQRDAIRFVLDSQDRAVNIQGAAGTGKTATLRELQRALREAGHEVLALAPTMSAVEELQKVGFKGAVTVERLLQDKRSHSRVRGGVLILDEAGMVSGRQMWELLRLTEQQSARIVFCGDTKQIQSVEACDALRVLEKESKLKSIQLTNVERQKVSAYRKAVQELRDDPLRGFERLENIGAVRQVAWADRAQAVASAYAEAKSRGKALVVCATHDEINNVTQAIRSNRKQNGELRQPVVLTRHVSLNWTTAQKKNLRNFNPGRLLTFHRQLKGIKKNETVAVIQVKRDRLIVRAENGEQRTLTGKQAKAFDVLETMPIEVAAGDQLLLTANRREPGFRTTNGEVVNVSSVDATGRIQLEDGRLLPPNFKQFAHGYAVTAHRSQGKSVDSVIISADGMHKELFYVAASRGRKHIAVITSDKERLRESVGRSTARQSASELLRHQREKQPVIRRIAFQNAPIVGAETQEKRQTPAYKDVSSSTQVLPQIDKSLTAAEAMAKKVLGGHARILAAQTDSGIYYGDIIGETDIYVLQRLSVRMAIVHEKRSLAFVPRVGAQVSIVYSRQLGTIHEIAARELEREISR